MAFSRRLDFFDWSSVPSHQLENLPGDLNVLQPRCLTAGRGALWIGDLTGHAFRIDRSHQVEHFQPHSRTLTHVYQLKEHDLLITIGYDEAMEEHLKVWNLSKWPGKPSPSCVRNASVTLSGQPASPVTCLCVESTQYIFLGHENGQLQLLRGPITSERQCKRHIIHIFPSVVTGIGFHLPHHQQQPGAPKQSHASKYKTDQPDRNPTLFVTTDQCIMSFSFGMRDEIHSKTILDRFGAGLHCSILMSVPYETAQYAVARRDAVYFYNADGRGPCLATTGDKLALAAFKQYLVILKGPSLHYLSPLLPPVDHSQSWTDSPVANDTSTTQVTIHDLRNKFIAGEFTIPSIHSMFVEWDAIYLFCSNPDPNSDSSRGYQLIGLCEKSTQSKLDMLYAKNNFQLAIDIAKSQKFGKEELAHIYSRFADHLYKQKEYDGAIKKYVETIGILEPSFVIQRFLEGGHINQLSYYLEALNAADMSSSDHIILLLNCYARLQDTSRIEQFVNNPINPRLHLSTAIHVLRQAHFSNAAFQLAQRTNRYSDMIRILMEDMDDSSTALKTLQSFPFDEALKAVCAYGDLFMDQCPEATISFLDQLCCQPQAVNINVYHFLKIFINNREGLMEFLRKCISSSGKSLEIPGLVDVLLELILYEWDRCGVDKEDTKRNLSNLATDLLENKELAYDDRKALLVCHQRQYFAGCIYLWEKLQLFDHLLRHYIDMKESHQVLKTCERFGSEMPALWLDALRYFASKPECTDELPKVLSEIDHHNLLTPLAVLQVLTDTDAEHSCQVGTVRDYFLQHLEAGANQIDTLREEVQQLQSETMRNREVVRALNSEIKIFQQQKCALCHQSLEPPSVHFLCDHSYHKFCFENYTSNDQQCPECAPKNRKILAEIMDSRDAASATTDISSNRVLEELRTALSLTEYRSGDRHMPAFSVSQLIAGQFARGVFNSSNSPASVRSQPLQFDHPGSSPESNRLLPTRQPSPSISSMLSRVTPFDDPHPQVVGSVGYSSMGIQPQSTRSSALNLTTGPVTSTNPFGDSDSDSNVLEVNGRHKSDSHVDAGIGPSVQSSSNPFDRPSLNPFN